MRLTIALLFTSIPALFGEPNFFFAPSSEPTVAAQSIAWILLRHFSHSHEAILINPVFNGTFSGRLQKDLLSEVIRLIDARLVIRFYYPRKDFVRPRFMNVFVVDGYESFRQIYGIMHYKKFDSSGFYLVVVAGMVYEKSRELVRVILKDMWALDIVNVNVVVCGDMANDAVLIYSAFPYTSDHCGVVEPILWFNVTEGVGELEQVDLYPDRLRDFYGCALIAGTHEAKPYTIIPKLRNSSKIVVSGFEGDLVDMLAVKLNFSVQYEISAEAWGFARELGNSTGLMRMIQEEEVDFGVGCIAFAFDRHKYLKPGMAHYTTKVLFAVPSGRPFTAFEKLFRPFSASIWSLILLYLIAGAIVTCILLCSPRTIRNFIYGKEVDSPYLNMMNIFFGGSLERTPSRNFARTLLLLWIVFCFVIRTLYQGSLYQYLQRTMNHAPLESMEDIHRSGIRYYMMEIGQRYFVTMPHVLARTTYIQPGKDSLGNTVEKLGRHLIDGVVLISLDHAAYHNQIFPKQEFVYVAKEHVGVYPVGFYYPKKSRLTRVFDDQIRNIQSTGLIGFWLRKYGDYDFFQKQESGGGPRKLSNGHLAGGYQVFLGWLAVSCVVFGLELLSMRCAWLERFFEAIMERRGCD